MAQTIVERISLETAKELSMSQKRQSLIQQVGEVRKELTEVHEMEQKLPAYRDSLQHIASCQQSFQKTQILKAVMGNLEGAESIINKLEKQVKLAKNRDVAFIQDFNNQLVKIAKESFTLLNNIRRILVQEDITYEVMVDDISYGKADSSGGREKTISTKVLHLTEEEYLELFTVDNIKFHCYAALQTNIQSLSDIQVILGRSQIKNAMQAHTEDIEILSKTVLRNTKFKGRYQKVSQQENYIFKYLEEQYSYLRPYQRQEIFTGYREQELPMNNKSIDKYVHNWQRDSLKKVKQIGIKDGVITTSLRSMLSKTMFQGGDVGNIQDKRVSFQNNRFTSANAHLSTILQSLVYIDAIFPQDLTRPISKRKISEMAQQLEILFTPVETKLKTNIKDSVQKYGHSLAGREAKKNFKIMMK